MLQSWAQLVFLLLLIVNLYNSQSTNLQNIETFYPVSGSDPIPTSPISPSPPSLRSDVAKAVAATAAGTLVFAAVLFFVLQRYCLSRRRKQNHSVTPNPYAGSPAATPSDFDRIDGNVKGLIVNENGVDVLYWRKLEERNGFVKEVLQRKKQSDRRQDEEGEIERGRRSDRSRRREPITEVPLLREKSSSSYTFKRVPPEIGEKLLIQAVAPPPARQPPSAAAMEVKTVRKQVSPPPQTTPPPPPPPPVKKTAAPPPPPRQLAKSTGSKPPPANESKVNGEVKLKPLHWEKVNANPDHSMVLNKLDNGSFSFDGDLMEALFGYVAKNRASPKSQTPSTSYSQITILDPRKSQNTAIILKSLGITQNTLLTSLRRGHGLESDTIDKLAGIAPTKDEETKILSFAGAPATLADAESFLHGILKPIPSAFRRIQAMQFRSQYVSEISQIGESLTMLESGCDELRTRGLFMKLLEAILKAGNRMNAGTAQAFHLTALRRLSNVKSSDGKTTLLHFVVDEVVRSEGKRCALSRNTTLNRNNSNISDSSESSKQEREKQYTMLGLPVVGGLSSEFTNVKKSAGIDYDSFAGVIASLSKRVSESQKLVSSCESDGGGFATKMRGFLVKAEAELKVAGGEQRRVMEVVKRTTEYYQVGASKDRGASPLQLFVIVKDFLTMVDQVCVEIARNSQKKTPASGSSPPAMSTVKFPILPKHFLSDKSGSSSGESENE